MCHYIVTYKKILQLKCQRNYLLSWFVSLSQTLKSQLIVGLVWIFVENLSSGFLDPDPCTYYFNDLYLFLYLIFMCTM